MARRDDDDFEDDDVDERPRRRRSDDRPAKSGGMSTGAIVAIVLGVLGVLGLCGCGGLIAILLPATQKVREAAARVKSQNNMKQVALGMFNDSDMNLGFQAPYAGTNQNMSFRVALLPFVEQNSLFRQIDMTQAWDSPKNKPLTEAAVPTYADPANPAGGNQTPYRVFVGPGAVFDGSNKRVLPVTVRDGTSNTILFVSATQTVPWAKPQELPYGQGVPLPPLGNPAAGGFNAAMADGSVRFIKGTVPEADLRSLIEANDGRQVVLP